MQPTLSKPPGPPPAEDYEDDEFKDHAGPWLRLIGVLVVLVIAGVLWGRPAYQAYKTHRALEKVAAFEGALAAGDFKTVAPQVRLALGLAPMEPAVWRFAARYCAGIDSPEGVDYWQRLSQEPEFPAGDRLEFARYAIRMGRLDLADGQLLELLKGTDPGEEVWRLGVRVSRERGEKARMLQRARDWVRAAPALDEAQWTLGGVLLEFAEAEAQAEAKSILWTMAFGKGAFSAPALTILPGVKELSRGELDALRREAEGRSLSPAFVTGLRVRMDPSEPMPAIRRLVDQCIGTTNLVHRREAVVYLADHGYLREALELLPREIADTDERLRSARLQALLELDRLEEARVELEGLAHEEMLERHLRRCLEAQLAVKMGQNPRAGILLGEALTACKGRPAAVQLTATYAERLGFPKVALDAYTQLGDWPPAAVESSRQVFRLALLLDQPLAARDALHRCLRARPDDAALRVGAAYLDLLTDPRRAGDRLVEIESILAANPADEFTRATVALAHWRKGNLQAALATMEEGGVDWERSASRCRAIHAALLGANLQREAARRVARDVDETQLMSVEKELIAEWR
jgi:hypothetical protein